VGFSGLHCGSGRFRFIPEGSGRFGRQNPLENDQIWLIIASDMAEKPRKSPLSLIVSSETIAPPRPLGPHGMALWNDVQRAYAIADRGGIEILGQVCAAVDTIETLSEGIERDGVIVHTANGPKTHPAIKDQTTLRAFVCRGLERLGLNIEAIKPQGRQPSFASWIPPERR
jgi:Phage terminase, small subunit